MTPQSIAESCQAFANAQEPYGVFIPLETGLTPAAEMMNGRMAMIGLIFLVSSSMVSGMDILDIVNIGIGGLYGKIA